MEYAELNSIANIVSGYAIPSSDMTAEGTAIIKITNIREDGTLDLVNTARYNKPITDKLKKFLLREKDIVVCMTGATIGKVARILKIDQDYIVNQRVAIIRAKNPELQDFVYHILTLPTFRKYVEIVGYGAAQPNISASAIGKYKFLNTDNIPQQHRIASILSAYDTLIENNSKRIRVLEQMAENLYKEWFVRFRFPGHENTEFENGLPMGWNIAPLSSEFKTTSGGTPSRTNMNYYSGSIPWIKTGELQGTFILDTEEHITEEAVRKSSAKLIPAYSLLIAMYAGANVGNLGINSTLATCNQACCVITTKGRYPLYYLLYFLQTQKGFLQSISFGAAQQNISQDIIKKLKVLLPPIELCETFNKIVSPYLQHCELLMKENQILTRQRDLLLPRLMSGKLEVNA